MEKNYKILKFIIWVLVFAVLMAGAWVLYSQLSLKMDAQAIPTANETAAQAPDFTAYDADGNPVSLSDFQGKPVILNFWASWCGPCKSEMPEFQAAYETYGEDIHFIMVDMVDGYQETQEKGQALIDSSGYTFPIYFDTDMDAAIAYGVTAIPATYFLDSWGNVVTGARGALNAERLQQAIDLLLKMEE